jgi:hypothetical protein
VAKLFPKRPRPNATRGERRVLELLKGLDDNWYVLHSLEFVRGGSRGMSPGEADFVLLHRIFGMIVLEVKDGRYRVDKRRWTAIRRDGAEIELDRDPFQQAKNNRFAIRNLLKDRTGIKNVPVGHCVLFSDGRPSGPLGLDGPEAIVLTLASLSAPGPALRGVVEFWQQGSWSSDDDFQLALNALCPTSVIAPTLGYAIDLSAADLEKLTARQIEWTAEQVEVLTATSDVGHILVLGAAGTGKTVIAQERARSLAAKGAKVGLIGQHRHLRLQLRRKMRLTGVYSGEPGDVLADLYGPAALSGFDGEQLCLVALELADRHGPLLDHLIVDEAQSHDADLLEAMQAIVRPGGGVLLLADPYQRDDAGTWRPPGQYQTFWLTRNCRNVLPIAKVVARLCGAGAPKSGAAGALPVFTDSKDVELDAVAVAAGLLKDLTADQIVVLTESVAAQQSMRTALMRAKVDAAVVTRLGEPGMLVSTVDDFRGCEAEAVVYVTDRPPVDDRTYDYIAVSRACAFLHIIGPRARWETVVYLMGDQP